jgi:hypothetical protein
MCSNYGKQVVILKEITACSITGKDNTYIKYKYYNQKYVSPSLPVLFQASISKGDTTQQCIFHQNIRGLKGKVDELIEFISTGLPRILCIAEHHLNSSEIININMDYYKLRANYCRTNLKNGGVCIFIQKV